MLLHRRYVKFAAKPGAPPSDVAERLAALKLLLHLVGDLYHPLLAAAVRNATATEEARKR